MTAIFLTENDTSIFLTSSASIVNVGDFETASTWASKYIVKNEAIKWVVGKYVEAESANRNRHFWTLKDLQMARPTITHAPMNVNHDRDSVVGTFVATDFIYPAGETAAEQINPYIEALGAMWTAYFPERTRAVEQAFQTGDLFLSMECVADSITCSGPGGCGETFVWNGPKAEGYCPHLTEGASIRQLNGSHFVGGALVIPPERPAWRNASVNQLVNAHEHEDLINEVDQAFDWSEQKVFNFIASLLDVQSSSERSLRRAEAIGKGIGYGLSKPI